MIHWLIAGHWPKWLPWYDVSPRYHPNCRVEETRCVKCGFSRIRVR